MNELITKNSEWIIHFMSNLDRLLDGFEHLTIDFTITGSMWHRVVEVGTGRFTNSLLLSL